MTYHHFLLPVSIIIVIAFPFIYFKKIKQLDGEKRSKTKQLLTDIFSCLLLIVAAIMISIGICFSSIITTNAYLGSPKPVMISQPILKFSEETTKNGRERYYIDFTAPQTDNIIHLEVYKKYNEGDLFTKKMYIGYWGILFSKD